jgi:hypothetical protein
MTNEEISVVEQSSPTFERTRLAAASQELARQIAVSTPVRRPRRRLAVGIAAAAIVAVPTAAAATGVLDGLRSGIFGQPGKNSEDAGTSEWINICAPGYPALIREHTPDGPLPAGFTWARATQKQISQAAANPECQPGGHGAQQQEIGIVGWFDMYATCAWYSEAATAADAGEARRVTRAGHELKTLANSEVNRITDGGGLVEFKNRIADDVLAGDVAKARDWAQNCELIK